MYSSRGLSSGGAEARRPLTIWMMEASRLMKNVGSLLGRSSLSWSGMNQDGPAVVRPSPDGMRVMISLSGRTTIVIIGAKAQSWSAELILPYGGGPGLELLSSGVKYV